MNVVVEHLQADKKSGVLSYRRKFPKDLVGFIPSASPTGKGRVEFKVSLRAKALNAPGAMETYRKIVREYDAIVAEARRAVQAERKRQAGAFDNLDSEVIGFLAARFHALELASDDARRRDPDAKSTAQLVSNTMRRVGFDLPVVPESSEWTLSIRTAHEALRQSARTMRAAGDQQSITDVWSDVALALATEQGLVLKPDGQSHVALCEALNDAAVAASEDALRRLDGDLVPTPALPEGLARSRTTRASTLSLLDLFDKYAAVPGRHPKTVRQWRPYIAHLAKFSSNTDVAAITHDDLVAWRNHLRDNETFRGHALSAKTINGSYLGAASALFAWAKGDGIIPVNPMREVSKVRLPARPVTRKKSFTNEEALTILRASLDMPQSREGTELRNAKRWCPWLMAYSGARVNEVTQLRKEDICDEDGVMVMRLTPAAGDIKSKKYRVVPLHSHLLEQGFLEFVSSRPRGPLFYDPAKRRSNDAINRQPNRLGSKLSEWVRSLGIKDVMPNHAWRHLFISQAPRHGLDPRTTKAITGHSGSDTHEKTYYEEYPDVMARELEKMPRFLVVGAHDRVALPPPLFP